MATPGGTIKSNAGDVEKRLSDSRRLHIKEDGTYSRITIDQDLKNMCRMVGVTVEVPDDVLRHECVRKSAVVLQNTMDSTSTSGPDKIRAVATFVDDVARFMRGIRGSDSSIERAMVGVGGVRTRPSDHRMMKWTTDPDPSEPGAGASDKTDHKGGRALDLSDD